jgi:hypothetical protein
VTRIRLRIDSEAAYTGTPESTVNQGEIACGIDVVNEEVKAKMGTEDQQGYSSAVKVGSGLIGVAGEPLTAYSDGSIPDGSLVIYEGNVWNAEATPIEFATDTASGVLTYTASTDTWDTDTTAFVPSSLDGGTFTGTFVAPSFSGSYDPTIGAP